MLARALCQIAAGRSVEQRQVLLLDEPIANLDLKHQIGLLDTARELAEGGLAVVAVLHDLALAATYADRLVVMRAGRCVAAGPPAAVLDTELIRDVFEIDLAIVCEPSGLVRTTLARRSLPLPGK